LLRERTARGQHLGGIRLRVRARSAPVAANPLRDGAARAHSQDEERTMSEDDNAGRRGHKEEEEPILLGIPQNTLLDRLSSGVGVVAEADRAAYETDNDAQAWQNGVLRRELLRLHYGHMSS